MSSINPSRNTPPQAVVFDLGKVLLDFDYGRASQALAAQSDLDADSIQEIIDQTPLLHAYESGRISTDAFFEQFRELASYHGTCTEFATAFADIFVPIQSMLDLHDTLVVRGVPCHVFSNTNA
jgi:putative hydrolase of the HAD superfamily